MTTLSDEHLETVKEKYYVEKLSMYEISAFLNVSADAVLYFMRKHKLKRRTHSENNVIKFARKPASYFAVEQLNTNQELLKQGAVIMYWCEGGKADSLNGVDFANSDPCMILIFLRFLREICRVREDRLRVYLYCYSNQDPNGLLKYWSRLTNIPTTQFTKPYIRSDFNPAKTGKMSKGMVHIRYSDKKLLIQMLQWIEEYKRRFAPIV